MTERKSTGWKLPISGHLNFCDLIEAKMYNARTLVLSGEVEECGAALLTNQLQALSESDDGITLLITSYGGAADAGGAIIRAIRRAQDQGCQIIGEVRGYAMSMGALILQACDIRLAAPEDIVMMHGFVGEHVGDMRNAKADQEMTEKLTDIYAKFISARNTADDTKYHDEGYWRKMLEDSLPHYHFGHEALEVGLIDEVVLA